MKKIISVIILLVMLTGLIPSCGKAGGSSGKIQIVTTIFPEYDWVMNIVGDSDNIEVTMLLDNGVDLHSFQPSAQDIVKVSSCDMFIYVGGESDTWVKDVLKESVNDKMVVIDLCDVLGSSLKEEEAREGMQHEEEEEESGEPEYDEHIWLSIKNAQVLTNKIAEEICSIDPANKSIYEANLESYLSKLGELDKKYKETIDSGRVKTLLFGDRFPFRYLTDDYGLDYYAAFKGCSAESEASFDTVIFLAGKVDELGLGAVLTIEGGDKSIAETIVKNTSGKDAKILTLDSMQGKTSGDVKNGATYLSVMEHNLEVIRDALS